MNENKYQLLDAMKQPTFSSNSNTILIGTCRIKRPYRFFDREVRARTYRLHSHVHYPAEILQMIRYLQGEISLIDEAIPYVIDDVNTGNITSHKDLEKTRREALDALENCSQVILEVSSLKKILITGHCGKQYYANITSLNNMLKGTSKAEFIDIKVSHAKFFEKLTRICTKTEFMDDMNEVLERLKHKRVVLIPHFQAKNPKSGEPIAERIELAHRVESLSLANDCEYFDQTEIIRNLGDSVALKDSSHYSEAGEKAMAVFLASKILPAQEMGHLKQHVG